MFTLRFWADVAERALGSAAAVVAAALGGDVFNAWTLDWGQLVGLAIGAAMATVLKSFAARMTGDPESAGILPPKD